MPQERALCSMPRTTIATTLPSCTAPPHEGPNRLTSSHHTPRESPAILSHRIAPRAKDPAVLPNCNRLALSRHKTTAAMITIAARKIK